MRIIAGEFKKRKINSIKSVITRPTTDKVREAIFNMIGPIYEGQCLDLFAGTGSLGLEAISRGIEKTVFIEKNLDAIKVLNDNIKILEVEERTYLYKGDYRRALDKIFFKGDKFDLIFLDPPYNMDICSEIIKDIKKHNLLTEDGIIVCETDKFIEVDPNGYEIKQEKKYGITKVTILGYE